MGSEGVVNLWEPQIKVVNAVEDFWNHGGRSVMASMPTGTGKSHVFTEIIFNRYRSKKPIYFITHSTNLLAQASRHLSNKGIHHGIISPRSPQLRTRVQVISAQTLIRRIDQLPEPEFIVLEEAHHSTANMFKRPTEIWKDAKILGLTATPGRTSGQPLDMYEHLIQSESIRWFINEGYLSDYDYYAPEELDMSGVKKRMGDYITKEVETKVDNRAVIGNVVEHYKRWSDGTQGAAFGVSIKHILDITKQFNEAGYPMESLHSRNNTDVLSQIERLRSGGCNLISSCDIIGEGTDIPGLTTELDVRPTGSLIIFLQHAGRVLRAHFAPGYDLSRKSERLAAIAAGTKPRAIILDCVSNWTRHGLPDEEREWSLKGTNKSKDQEPSKYKRCPQCFKPVKIHNRNCPWCDYEFEYTASRIPAQKKGSLRKIESGSVQTAVSGWSNPENQRLLKLIAATAKNVGDAKRIAVEAGQTSGKGWMIWTKLLKRKSY